MKNLLFPPALDNGDKVILLSPSSKIDRRFLDGARKRLESWGLNVKLSKHASGSSSTYSGSLRQRRDDLQEALDDDEARLIFCSRGGYGAIHLIDKLDFTRFRLHPKWIAGYSDITVLHNLLQHEGFASLHAPMARHLTVEEEHDFCTQMMHDLLFGLHPMDYFCPSHPLNRKGEASGILRGGNLSVLYGLRGTPWDLPAPGTILFLEDVNEPPHAIERMMYNLRLGGVLEQLSGLIIGQFTHLQENRTLGKELNEALAELVADYDYPVCFGFPVGHVTQNYPLICGATVQLKVTDLECELIQIPSIESPTNPLKI